MISPSFLSHFQYGRPADGIMLQCIEGAISIRQGENLGLGMDRDLCRELQKIVPVLAGIIRNAANHALLIKQIVIKWRDGTHVDAAQHQRSAFPERFESSRHDLAGWGEYDRTVQRNGRGVDGASGPDRAEFQRELLMAGVASTRINFVSPMARDLNRDVRSGAESIKAQASASLGVSNSEAAKPNDSRAEERRGCKIGESVGNWIEEAFLCEGIFGVPSIHGIAGECRMITEIFFAAVAIFTSSVGRVQPRDAGACSNWIKLRAFAHSFNGSDDLMAGCDGRFARRELPFDHVQIGPANAARIHAH